MDGTRHLLAPVSGAGAVQCGPRAPVVCGALEAVQVAVGAQFVEAWQTCALVRGIESVPVPRGAVAPALREGGTAGGRGAAVGTRCARGPGPDAGVVGDLAEGPLGDHGLLGVVRAEGAAAHAAVLDGVGEAAERRVGGVRVAAAAAAATARPLVAVLPRVALVVGPVLAHVVGRGFAEAGLVLAGGAHGAGAGPGGPRRRPPRRAAVRMPVEPRKALAGRGRGAAW